MHRTIMHRTILTHCPLALYARQFSSSHPSRKTVTEKMTEVADQVNKSVGRGLASAIEMGEEATQKTKDTVAGAKRGADKVADKMSNVAKDKKEKVGAEVNSTKEEIKDATRK